ncbi:hypothetical protein [Promicromonospora sp. MEB111]|uniref:hypothetical protein n=1 Tax=Promicromonospora sp. MEB111 TaxID=3040301 RepID=UPI00254F772A|nr:hypothetical protein [Promicromonospora sp. MEB111]
MRALTRAQGDPLARARRALDQVDEELDLARVHAVTSGHGRVSADPLPVDDDAEPRVEILTPGQRPARPRRRATVWALAATVALLCGAGVGTAMLWSGSGETVPGSTPPASPAPEQTGPTQPPAQEPSPDPRECSPARPTPSATPEPTTDDLPTDACDVPSPPSERAGMRP